MSNSLVYGLGCCGRNRTAVTARVCKRMATSKERCEGLNPHTAANHGSSPGCKFHIRRHNLRRPSLASLISCHCEWTLACSHGGMKKSHFRGSLPETIEKPKERGLGPASAGQSGDTQ